MHVARLSLHLFACSTILEALRTDTNSHNRSSGLEPHIEVRPTYIKHIAAETASRSPGAKLAVCIVGQLSRLEIESKMKNLFQSGLKDKNSKDVVGVDVFVVAETDSDFYVNQESVKSNEDICHKDFRTPTEVEEQMRPFYRAGLYLKPSFEGVTVNLKNWHNYGATKPQLNTSLRLWGHMNQWTHLRQCAELIKDQEKRTGRWYTTVMKIRDNGIVTKTMSISADEAVVVKRCASWGGVNDKAFIAPRKYLEHVFERPIDMAIQVNNGDRSVVKLIEGVANPEQFLLTVYNHHGVKIKGVALETFTVVDGRCIGAEPGNRHRTWCLVPKGKDCHPWDAFKEGYVNCPAFGGQ